MLSSVIWSSYHKGMLASSDYEGTVTLWDAFVGTKTKIFQVLKLVLKVTTLLDFAAKCLSEVFS